MAVAEYFKLCLWYFSPQESYSMYLNGIKIVILTTEACWTEHHWNICWYTTNTTLSLKRTITLDAASSTDEHVFPWKFSLNVHHNNWYRQNTTCHKFCELLPRIWNLPLYQNIKNYNKIKKKFPCKPFLLLKIHNFIESKSLKLPQCDRNCYFVDAEITRTKENIKEERK